jgi:type II secretory pathway pseudopilin PulG
VTRAFAPSPGAHGARSGYALLFVLAIAATVAIMLLTQVPRVAFEAQRDREQLLIDRGEEYSRAVRLYVRKFNRYPGDMEALENTQNTRFLRHRYIDPMTGTEDWRLIHIGPGGLFLDSLVYGKSKSGNPLSQNDPRTSNAALQPVSFATGSQSTVPETVPGSQGLSPLNGQAPPAGQPANSLLPSGAASSSDPSRLSGGPNSGNISPSGALANQFLTTSATAPNGAAPGDNAGTSSSPPAGQVIGGGLAGVASQQQHFGIKIYKERSKYNEWEFVYDITADLLRGGFVGQALNPGNYGTGAPGAPPPISAPGPAPRR